MNNQYLKRIQYSSELGQHKQSVAQLLVHFDYYLDLELEYIERSYLVGMLHDIGKTIIDIDILTKKGKLTFEEQEEMKRHVSFGCDNTTI